MLNSRPPELSAWGCLPKNFMTSDDLRYGKVTIAMCKDKRITDTDRTIYAYIKAHVNWRIYQTQVASELGISLSTVKRSMNRLDAAGYLSYDVKETELKRERRNLTMLDQPTTWVKNEPPEGANGWVKNEPQVGQICTTSGSKLNHVWVKNEPSGGSNLNHNVASNVASIYKASSTNTKDEASPHPLAELAKGDSAEGAAAYAAMTAEIFSKLKVVSDQPVKPISREGATVRNGLLISRFGTVLGKA